MNKKEYKKKYYNDHITYFSELNKYYSSKRHKTPTKKYENPDNTPDTCDIFEENRKRFCYGKSLIY